MKKICSILLALIILIVPMSVSASAAGDINANEKEILESLSEKVDIKGKKFIIPPKYVNQAENYFKTIDIDDTECAEILIYIEEGKKIVAASDIKKTSDLKVLPYPQKKRILELGQMAVAVTGGNLVYTKDETVRITNAKGEVIFDSAPIIKQTGAEIDFTTLAIASASVIVLLGGAVVISKKRGLFVK